eukprot:g756.t1
MAKYSVEELVRKANEFLKVFNLEMGATFLQRALAVDPSRTDVMDQFAAVLLEMGAHTDAESLLRQSINIAPDASHEKHLYLGQILTGFDAVACFRKGIDILTRKKSEIEASGDFMMGQSVANEIASAWCSIVEVYMSDLCFENDAEARCDEAILVALEAAPDSIMVLQTLANLRMCQNNRKEASAAMKKVCKLLAKCKENEEAMPSFQERTVIVKLLIELGQSQIALDLVTGLLEEDDDTAEVWYLAGVAARDTAGVYIDRMEKGKSMKRKGGKSRGKKKLSSEEIAEMTNEAEGLINMSEQYLSQAQRMLQKVQSDSLVQIANGEKAVDVSGQLEAIAEAQRALDAVKSHGMKVLRNGSHVEKIC